MLIIASVMMSAALFAQDIKVVSYNIRSSDSKDGTNSWVYRYAASADMIKDQAADIYGIQEATKDQIYFIEQNFRDYKCVGETNPVFYNKKTVSVQKSGSFDHTTWALVKTKKGGNRFYVVNIDIQDVPEAERKAALNAILDGLAEVNKDSLPVVITGGFYLTPSDPALADVEAKMSNARKTAAKTDNTGTYTNWGKTSQILDHIYYSGFNACPEYQTVTKKYSERKFVSDHYPLMVILTF